MKNRYFIISIILWLCVMNVNASTNWLIQGVEYKVDTLSHVLVGPGTTQTSLGLSGPVKLRIFYTTTDMSNPNVALKTIMAKDNLTSNLIVPAMPDSHSDTDNIYFAGVNADFIGGMGTVGTTCVNGEMYKSYKDRSGWYAIGIDKDKKIYSGAPFTTFRMVSPNAGQASIKAINAVRSSNELILFTSRKGSSTGTSGKGVEVAAVAVDGGLKSNGTTKMRVTVAPVKDVGNMIIPANGFVLSGTGFTADIIAKMKLGEEFEVTPTIYFDNIIRNDIVEMSGGCPMLLQSGKILETQGLLDHLKNREPRTAMGYDADATKVILLVVDGRQPGVSVGVTSKDLASIMLNLGCSDALNFDGGGSSTLYVKELGVRNMPSEGRLRAVKNGMFISTPATNDNQIATIRFADYVGRVEHDSYYTPIIYGYNSQGVLIDTNVKGVTFSCSSDLGIVQDDRVKIKYNGSGTHALTATLGDITTSIPVTINGGSGVSNIIQEDKVVLYPNPIKVGEQALLKGKGKMEIVIYNLNGQVLDVLRADNDNTLIALPTESLTAGIYIISVTTKNHNTKLKLTIQ